MKAQQIELTNREIGNSLAALQQIKSDDIEIKMNYTMSLNQKELRKKVEDFNEYRTGILKEHCELDAHGEPVVSENKQDYVYKSETDEKAAFDKAKELNNTSVSLNLYTYPLVAFGKAKISHNLLEHLTWMVRFDDEQTEPEQPKKKGKAAE